MYTFPHRTFQEYLAARYLTTYKFPTELARLTRTDPERWREAALLAAAKSKGGADYAMWSLVDRLCRHDATDKSTVEDHWGALVAGQALAETVDPALKRDDEAQDEIFERVQNWQVHILKSSALPAIERTYAGDSLATLGDPRFDANHWHLPKESLWGFVEIPEGEFIMGDDEDDRAKPQHKLKLLRYFIARYPTTVAQFKKFVDESGHKPENPDSLRDPLNRPVRYVPWHEAIKYCDWLTDRLKSAPDTPEPLGSLLRKEKWRITLPSEAQLEKAARGIDGRAFPWGNDFDKENVNISDTGIGTTSAVGAFPKGKSQYGLLDISGNVWEWCLSKYKPYPYKNDDGRNVIDKNNTDARVVRGGAFNYVATSARCAYRGWFDPNFRLDFSGFRVVASTTF